MGSQIESSNSSRTSPARSCLSLRGHVTGSGCGHVTGSVVTSQAVTSQAQRSHLTECTHVPLRNFRLYQICLRACYTMSGTDIAHAPYLPTRMLRDVRY
eukprot:3941389-Rhodomonas_salina.2